MHVPPTLFIIEPQELFVPHLRWLALEAELPVVGTTMHIDPPALDRAAPDVVLIDVDFLEDSPAHSVRLLRDIVPNAAILVLADLDPGPPLDELLAAGAHAVLPKSATEEDVVAALDALRRKRACRR